MLLPLSLLLLRGRLQVLGAHVPEHRHHLPVQLCVGVRVRVRAKGRARVRAKAKVRVGVRVKVRVSGRVRVRYNNRFVDRGGGHAAHTSAAPLVSSPVAPPSLFCRHSRAQADGRIGGGGRRSGIGGGAGETNLG